LFVALPRLSQSALRDQTLLFNFLTAIGGIVLQKSVEGRFAE
jgi:hypothetical protein